MTDSKWTNLFLSPDKPVPLSKARLSLNTPEALTDPHVRARATGPSARERHSRDPARASNAGPSSLGWGSEPSQQRHKVLETRTGEPYPSSRNRAQQSCH